MQITTKSDIETREMAKNIVKENIGNIAQKPLIILLSGELGTGKTTFTKGIGDFFGLNKIVSPSFVINCEYDIANSEVKKLIHFDFYNLKDCEYDLIGLDESLVPGNVVVIEWPENNKELIEKISNIGKVIDIKLEHVNENERKISI